MEGMTKAEVDKAEHRDIALGRGPLKPRDSATLMLLDRQGGDVVVLMGRRHMNHAFMPGKFVFPGGRTDPADGRIPVAEGLHPAEEAKLSRRNKARTSPVRARAIAMSAIRETYEEAGLLIGKKAPFSSPRKDWQGFADHGVRPSLESLRLIARAITPPGRVRRFDTRFFAAWRSDVAVELAEGGPTEELQELVWVTIPEARKTDIPNITGVVLDVLEARLRDDPLLRPGGQVPFFRMLQRRFVKEDL